MKRIDATKIEGKPHLKPLKASHKVWIHQPTNTTCVQVSVPTNDETFKLQMVRVHTKIFEKGKTRKFVKMAYADLDRPISVDMTDNFTVHM
jgi:hypothetical protein